MRRDTQSSKEVLVVPGSRAIRRPADSSLEGQEFPVGRRTQPRETVAHEAGSGLRPQ